MIGRCAGTVAPSSGPRPSTSTWRSASSGSSASTGSSSRSRHSSTRISAATAVDRLRHRRDAEDAVAAHRFRLAPREVPGDAELDVVTTGRQPRHAADRVVVGMTGHDVTQALDSFVVESIHRSGTLGRKPAMARSCRVDRFRVDP